MRLDIQTLGTFNSLADEGARAAADALTQLTGNEVGVSVTRADLVSLPDLAGAFAGEEFAGVELATGDGLEGTIVLVFNRDSADRLLDAVMPDSWGETTTTMDQSGVSEVANIMVGGFVDAWADHFDRKISLGPPTYVAGEWPTILPEEVPLWDDRQTAMTFTSQLTSDTEIIEFYLYLFPQRESLELLIDSVVSAGELPVSVDKLSLFNEMTKTGAQRAAEKITQMTNIETDVDISRLTFVPADDIGNQFQQSNRITTVTHLQGPPGGHIAILFDPDSARTIADALLPIDIDDPGLTDHHRSAIEEIGNIMTSGFIDGWANTLDRKIQHVPPELTEGTAADTISELATDFDPVQEYVFLFDSTVQTPDETVSVEIIALPDHAQLKQVLDELSVERATAAVENPEKLEPSEYDDLR